MDWIRYDLMYALRRLARRPAMSALAIATLAIGLGVNTVAFSAINALIFKPFHIPNGDRIGWLMLQTPSGSGTGITLQAFDAIARETHTLDAVAASTRTALADTTGNSTREAWALLVSPSFFDMMPPSLKAGRALGADDATNDATRNEITAVISERYWSTHFNSNPDLASLPLS